MAEDEKVRKIIGRHIVADPRVRDGAPTFRDTDILVEDVLKQVAEGLAWESIVESWDNQIEPDSIEEALKLARKALFMHVDDMVIREEPSATSSSPG